MTGLESIFPEDVKLFNEVFGRYLDIVQEDGNEAFELAKLALALAERWSEIATNVRKVTTSDYSKTDMKEWAYHKYRDMQFVHEHCRMIWKQANEQALYFERNQGK